MYKQILLALLVTGRLVVSTSDEVVILSNCFVFDPETSSSELDYYSSFTQELQVGGFPDDIAVVDSTFTIIWEGQQVCGYVFLFIRRK